MPVPTDASLFPVRSAEFLYGEQRFDEKKGDSARPRHEYRTPDPTPTRSESIAKQQRGALFDQAGDEIPLKLDESRRRCRVKRITPPMNIGSALGERYAVRVILVQSKRRESIEKT